MEFTKTNINNEPINNKKRVKNYCLRFYDKEIDIIETHAKSVGMSPTSMLRMYIRQKLIKGE